MAKMIKSKKKKNSKELENYGKAAKIGPEEGKNIEKCPQNLPKEIV